MINARILDRNGVWVMNRSEFRMVDTDSGTIYEPGIPMKVSDTEWRKARADVISDVADPYEDATPVKQIKAETPLKDNGKK